MILFRLLIQKLRLLKLSIHMLDPLDEPVFFGTNTIQRPIRLLLLIFQVKFLLLYTAQHTARLRQQLFFFMKSFLGLFSARSVCFNPVCMNLDNLIDMIQAPKNLLDRVVMNFIFERTESVKGFLVLPNLSQLILE